MFKIFNCLFKSVVQCNNCSIDIIATVVTATATAATEGLDGSMYQQRRGCNPCQQTFLNLIASKLAHTIPSCFSLDPQTAHRRSGDRQTATPQRWRSSDGNTAEVEIVRRQHRRGVDRQMATMQRWRSSVDINSIYSAQLELIILFNSIKLT